MKCKKNKTRKIYTKKDYNSNDGMLTSVWGPPAWHFLHTISFNYPNAPSVKQKKNYKSYFSNLLCVLPCGHCRTNFKKNLKKLPITQKVLKNRENFSKWVFDLHELINKMLCKKSGLTYEQVRERYEHFRSRCTLDKTKKTKKNKKPKKTKTRKKEKGCTRPLYGKKSKCIMKIVPHDTKVKTLSIDKQCIKSNEK
jgi:hypothetical protein